MSNGNSDVIKTLRSKSADRVNAGKKYQHTVALDYSDINPLFLGTLTFHRPSQFEEMEIGVKTTQLLGNTLNVDIKTGNLALMIATLDVIVDNKPDWFDVFDPDLEYEVLEAVYLAYIEWLNSFRRDSGKPNTTSNSGTANGEGKVVDTEGVQSTAN